MTKEEILAYFQDINAAYNECGRYNDLKRMLDELTERKTGRWEYYGNRNNIFDWAGVKTWGRAYRCNNCGFIHVAIENHGIYTYCPQCGARMTEDKNENNN